MTSTTTPFHPGITPELVVDAAVSLTHDSHLYGWSIRDLARELGVTPSVIYHHVGGKDLIAKSVAERVIATIELPSEHLDWREWFRTLLTDSIYPVIVAHPGVAKWLLMHGVPFLAAVGVFETGIGKLQQNGFGAGAPMVYAAIMNSAMMTVSLGDDRLLHEDDGPRDHAAMMGEFRGAFAGHPLLEPLSEEFFGSLAVGGETAARMRRSYFGYAVDVTLAGVTSVDPPKTHRDS